MIWVFLLFLLIQLVGYTVVGMKLLLAITRKNKPAINKNAGWLLILLIFSGLVLKKLPGSDLFYWPFEVIDSKIYTKNLTNKSFILKKPIHEWDSERHFNGDGSSIAIYPLSEELSSYFSKPDSIFFKDYPKKGIRNDWEVSNWTETPLKKEHFSAFSFVSYLNDKSSDYNLEELLNDSGNYYSFYFYQHYEFYGNVDFYILCPKEKILIVMNQNT